MTPCPNSTAGGCRCPEHHPGLAQYAADPAAYEAALAPLRPVQLRVVTAGPSRAPECTGTMTCSCLGCLIDRHDRVERGTLQGDRQQPWHPRPARHQRAA